MFIKFGRYFLVIGPVFWMQTKVPVKMKHFLCLWFGKEARPWEIDKIPQYPLNTRMQYNGRVYRYWKAGENIKVGET